MIEAFARSFSLARQLQREELCAPRSPMRLHGGKPCAPRLCRRPHGENLLRHSRRHAPGVTNPRVKPHPGARSHTPRPSRCNPFASGRALPTRVVNLARHMSSVTRCQPTRQACAKRHAPCAKRNALPTHVLNHAPRGGRAVKSATRHQCARGRTVHTTPQTLRATRCPVYVVPLHPQGCTRHMSTRAVCGVWCCVFGCS